MKLKFNKTNNHNFGQRNMNRSRHTAPVFDNSLFIKKAVETQQEEYVPEHNFTDFLISDSLKHNIVSRGYKTPTPIQDKTIPPLLEGRDVIGIANTGTGKTAAFLIPLINKIVNARTQKVLIITPTRELAVQIQDEFIAFARNLNLSSVLCIGGVNIYTQIQHLRRNPHFVIGTPGRLKDLEQQGKIHFGDYQNIVLDEVDRMLDMGFISDITYITSRLPKNRQSLFFSATLPAKVKSVMQTFLRNPITISVKSADTSSNVDQDIVKLNGRAKIDVLHDLLAQDGFSKVLVFGRTKHGMEKLFRLLTKRGFKVAAIHGNKNQNQRQRALEEFKHNRINILLATDVASRGLDIDNVTHVINYDTPQSFEDYVHRIGRTGRANNKGVALTFVD